MVFLESCESAGKHEISCIGKWVQPVCQIALRYIGSHILLQAAKSRAPWLPLVGEGLWLEAFKKLMLLSSLQSYFKITNFFKAWMVSTIYVLYTLM